VFPNGWRKSLNKLQRTLNARRSFIDEPNKRAKTVASSGILSRLERSQLPLYMVRAFVREVERDVRRPSRWLSVHFSLIRTALS
jgi:hypothetical protein